MIIYLLSLGLLCYKTSFKFISLNLLLTNSNTPGFWAEDSRMCIKCYDMSECYVVAVMDANKIIIIIEQFSMAGLRCQDLYY
jgi:hypothetical protein